MAAPADTLPSKFLTFLKATVSYKEIRGHGILVDVFVPKAVCASNAPLAKKRPVIVFIHGGFLVSGSRDFEAWIPTWLVDYAVEHNASFVSPDYRLMPEAKGSEILDDMDDFWSWMRAGDGLAQTVKNLHPDVEVDLDKVLATGVSAGGYLALQAGFDHPHLVRAVVAPFPMAALDSPHWSEAYEKAIFGFPQLDASIISSHLDATSPDSVISSATPMDRIPLAVAMVQHGRFLELFLQCKGNPSPSDSDPDNARLFPLLRLRRGDKLPPTFIYHGAEDSVVPVQETEKFVELAKSNGNKISFAKIPGEHLVATDTSLTSEVGEAKDGSEGDQWLRDGLLFVQDAWLGTGDGQLKAAL